jgi:hypothetical protein
MDFTPSLNAKGFYRLTGPPENWLTGIKHMTWGLEEKHRARWADIQTGDIFFIHSTGPQSSYFSNAKSGIIGLGVVGANFNIKDYFLWMQEFKEQVNRWPLLVPFSEIYLFSELPPIDSWAAPTLDNAEKTKDLVSQLLAKYIPLDQVRGFPVMGSFSSVSKEVAQQILYDKRLLHIYSGNVENNIFTTKPTKLSKIDSASESLRYAETLSVFDNINARIINETPGVYAKDNEMLARAEVVHSTILQSLIDIFKSKGYDTRSNRFVDLFAYNEDRCYLVEVKSTENKNFRSQARKGIIQLFENDYFDINRFTEEEDLHLSKKYKILVTSTVPQDENYIAFLNKVDIGIGVMHDKAIKSIGSDFGLSNI